MNQAVYELNLMLDPNLPFRSSFGAGKMWMNHTINWHENIEILYCSSGEGYVFINETRYPFKEGDIVVVNSEEIHRVQSNHVNPRCSSGTFQTLIIDRHFCAECGIPSTTLIFQSHIRDAQIKEAFIRIMDAYKRYVHTGEFYEAIHIRALLLDFLCRLCQDYLVSEQGDGPHKRNDALQTAVTYIREHLAEPITINTLTQLTGLSESTLLRRFKRAFGRSVIDTILLLRCTEAKRLLEMGCSVSEAARSCGFDNMSYFTSVFKRYYDAPPSTFIQNI